MTQQANFAVAADVLDRWRENVLSGTPPKMYAVGDGDLKRIEVGPGLVTLIGGAPGAGKTAFTMQLVVDALRLSSKLQVLVCNIEMPPDVLLDRQLARLSGVELTTIRYRQLTDMHALRIEAGLETLTSIAERLCFVRTPFDLPNVAACADEFFEPGGESLIILDYIQRISPPGDHGDKRGAVDACMNFIRQFADNGVAVIVVSAVARSKDSSGRNAYGVGLNLASFRESSELEFGCDSAYILKPASEKQGDNTMELLHLKDRHGQCQNIKLDFDKSLQRFSAIQKLRQAHKTFINEELRQIWNKPSTAKKE